jgi:hypothetical protein
MLVPVYVPNCRSLTRRNGGGSARSRPIAKDRGCCDREVEASGCGWIYKSAAKRPDTRGRN